MYHYNNCLLEYLPLLTRINMEYDIRYKPELQANVRNNVPMSPFLTHDPIVYIIYVIKIIDSVG